MLLDLQPCNRLIPHTPVLDPGLGLIFGLTHSLLESVKSRVCCVLCLVLIALCVVFSVMSVMTRVQSSVLCTNSDYLESTEGIICCALEVFSVYFRNVSYKAMCVKSDGDK